MEYGSDQVDAEISLIFSNMAAVHLKKGSYARAIACSDDALKVRPLSDSSLCILGKTKL